MGPDLMCGADLLASTGQCVWSMAELVLKRCYARGLEPCRRFLQTVCHLRNPQQMTEGRLGQVRLLDDRQLELIVQPKLLSRDLLDLVASHFNLKEKEYFGISFTDETGQSNWLQLDKKVLDHSFSKKSGTLELKFLVRFYIESITCLKDTTTIELFFLNAKFCIFNGLIEVDSDHVFKLGAYALQEAKGDYTSDECTREDLKKLPSLPTKVLTEHPSLAYCEDRVIEHYKKLQGISRGQAIVKYLALVQSLPNYGVHYYEVKDKQGIPWWLGVSYKGVGQFDQQDKSKPRKFFQWKQLENLYFREKKFAVEVNDPHRGVVSKRTFGQSGLAIHSWYASHTLIKTIWVMAISQHQFYLDRKQSKAKLTAGKSLGDIAMDLTEIGAPRVSKLVSMECKDQLIMASNGSLVSTGSADSEANEEKKQEKISELKKKEKNLQDSLSDKMDELKKICLREAELTGRLPKEYPLQSGEKAPAIRKRVGTAFKLDDLFPYNKDPHLRNLESRFALQQKIVEAAMKLAGEGDLCKTVKKKRRRNCLDSMRKLQEIEDEINAYRIKMGKTPTQRASIIIDEANPSDLSSLSDSLTLEDDDALVGQRQRSRSVQYSDRPSPSESLSIQYFTERRVSTNDQLQDANCNSYDDGPQHFRQRSGSLESQQAFLTDMAGGAHDTQYSHTMPRRSTSTEILDDGSSYTSQSSVEYGGYRGGGGSTISHVPRVRRRHQRGHGSANIYANTGSMPNLAQQETYRTPRPTTTAYYVTGYPSHTDPDPYSNGAYAYENETEGHYSVNTSAYYYQQPPQHHQVVSSSAYHVHEAYRGYDELDGLPQHNPYATLRPSRSSRPPSRNDSGNMVKNMQKAMVAEHLRGWYHRNTGGHKQMSVYDYEGGSHHSMGYQTMSSAYSHGRRNTSFSSVSSATSAGNWRSHHQHHLQPGLDDYEPPLVSPQPYGGGYGSSHYVQQPPQPPAQSRSFADVRHMDEPPDSKLNRSFDSEDHVLYWHEDSKPGTIV